MIIFQLLYCSLGSRPAPLSGVVRILIMRGRKTLKMWKKQVFNFMNFLFMREITFYMYMRVVHAIHAKVAKLF